MTRDLEDYEALDALAWQIELGADEAISEEPINRFEAVEPEPVRKAAPKSARVEVSVPSGPVDGGAADIAAGCRSIDALRLAVEAFEGCALKRGARSTVFCDGNPEADVMIIGQAPDREEDLQGKPFVGRNGQLLDKMLAAIGLDRNAEDASKAVYIANVMPWRPPQNREPSPEELQMMKAFLVRHITLAAPKFIVTMGHPASKALLDVADLLNLKARLM